MIKLVHYIVKIEYKSNEEFMKKFEKYRRKLPKDTRTLIEPPSDKS